MRARVEHWLAIHQQKIVVMPVAYGDVEPPGAVEVFLHGMRGRIPIVEVTDDEDGLRGSKVHEGHRFDDLLGGIGLFVGVRMPVFHAY